MDTSSSDAVFALFDRFPLKAPSFASNSSSCSFFDAVSSSSSSSIRRCFQSRRKLFVVVDVVDWIDVPRKNVVLFAFALGVIKAPSSSESSSSSSSSSSSFRPPTKFFVFCAELLVNVVVVIKIGGLRISSMKVARSISRKKKNAHTQWFRVLKWGVFNKKGLVKIGTFKAAEEFGGFSS